MKDLFVDVFLIVEVFYKFLEFLKKFDSVILIVYNGRVFYFRVVLYDVNWLGICDIFLKCVIVFVDLFVMFCFKVLKFSLYK